MQDLRHLLEEHYSLGVKSIAPGPRQFVAETYVVETDVGQTFFVKRFPPGRLPLHALEGLPVLGALHCAGFTRISLPIATRGGALYVADAGAYVVVFEYLRACQTSDEDRAALGRLIGQLHGLTGKIAAAVAADPFAPHYFAALDAGLAAAALPARDEIVAGLQDFLRDYGAEIRADRLAFEQICAACRAAGLSRVLTHGDAPGNDLRDAAGNIYLVDWDEILLAPPERDTWFLVDDPAFMAGYRERWPDYVPDDLAYRFYLYNRYFEDLLGYVKEIMVDGSDEHRAKNLRELHETCVDWLRPLIRGLAAN